MQPEAAHLVRAGLARPIAHMTGRAAGGAAWPLRRDREGQMPWPSTSRASSSMVCSAPDQ
jgi:hypothetical protein